MAWVAVAGCAVLVILAAVAWFVMNRPAGEADPETEAAALESAPDLDAPAKKTASEKKPAPNAKAWKPPEPPPRVRGPLDDALDAQPNN